MRCKDLLGKRFKRLLVVERIGKDKYRRMMWRCACDCGGELITATVTLTAGKAKSCGCWHKDAVTVHGYSKHPIYRTWRGMMSRCYDQNSNRYEMYAGRGIHVCERWQEFDNFIEDMLPSMPKGNDVSIERIDNEQGYYKENCRWATAKEQARNRRTTVFVKYKGKEYPLAELAEIHDIPYQLFYKRIRVSGWSVERALKN